jgi:hypothetical protein
LWRCATSRFSDLNFSPPGLSGSVETKNPPRAMLATPQDAMRVTALHSHRQLAPKTALRQQVLTSVAILEGWNDVRGSLMKRTIHFRDDHSSFSDRGYESLRQSIEPPFPYLVILATATHASSTWDAHFWMQWNLRCRLIEDVAECPTCGFKYKRFMIHHSPTLFRRPI